MAKQHWKAGNMLYPVPAVMVSCQRKGEKPNIITVAWAGTVCSDPAMVSISIRPERYSYGIIHETGEFVINLVTEALCESADYCGVASGRDVDKFEKTGLTAESGNRISAPGISESPVNIECLVKQEISLGSHVMFLAEVVGVNVDESFLNDKGSLLLNDVGLVSYSHGTYFLLGKKLGTFGYSVRKKNTSGKTTNQKQSSKRTSKPKKAGTGAFRQTDVPKPPASKTKKMSDGSVTNRKIKQHGKPSPKSGR